MDGSYLDRKEWTCSWPRASLGDCPALQDRIADYGRICIDVHEVQGESTSHSSHLSPRSRLQSRTCLPLLPISLYPLYPKTQFRARVTLRTASCRCHAQFVQYAITLFSLCTSAWSDNMHPCLRDPRSWAIAAADVVVQNPCLNSSWAKCYLSSSSPHRLTRLSLSILSRIHENAPAHASPTIWLIWPLG